MSLPPNQTLPEDDPQLPAARRRHAQRSLFGPLGVDERSQALEELARRAAPNFDFFLYSLCAGFVIGLGLLTDSPYLLILGALIAPLMAPAVGVALGTALGSSRHFMRNLGGLLVASGLVFAAGLLAGLAGSRAASVQADAVTQFSLPALLATGAAGVLAAATLIRSNHNPEVPSLLLAYALYVPVAAAGFGISSGQPHLWPDGLVLFAIHLAWSTLCGAVALAIIGFRPPSWYGYSLSAAVLLAGVLLFIGFTGAGAVFGARLGLPTLTPSPTLSPSPSLTATITTTPQPTATATRTSTPTASLTPSPTATPQLAVIESEGNGAFIREEPAGVAITTILNGTAVQLLPEPAQEAGGQLWLHVYLPERDLFGWILQSLLATATPAP